MKFEVDKCMDNPLYYEVLGPSYFNKKRGERSRRVYATFYQPNAKKHAKLLAKVLETLYPDGWAKPEMENG